MHMRRLIGLYRLRQRQRLCCLWRDDVEHLLELPFWVKLALGQRLGKSLHLQPRLQWPRGRAMYCSSDNDDPCASRQCIAFTGAECYLGLA